MRPALKAGLRPVWRNRDTLQIGVDPRRAVALTGIGPAAAVISLLDGSRDTESVLAMAQSSGVPAAAARRVLDLLAVAGVLDDFPAALHRSLPDELRARLVPELATASLAYADGDGGARTLARRRSSYVRVHGAGRIGAGIATLLAASGIGRVVCVDPVPARPSDTGAGGLVLTDVGVPRDEAVAEAIRRIAPEVSTRDAGIAPDLAVLTALPSPDLPMALAHESVPHLAARAAEAIGVVGPLVRPGRSACLRCVDLCKADGDTDWPKILAQATLAGDSPGACDSVLACMTATLAAAQALAFIDGVLTPVTVNGTLEIVLPGWQWRRRTWAPQGDCPCGALHARD